MALEDFRAIRIPLDLANDYVPTVRLTANDHDGRSIRIVVTDAGANVTSGVTGAKLCFNCWPDDPDSSGGYVTMTRDATADTLTYEAPVPQEALQVQKVLLCVQLLDGESIVASRNFWGLVDDAVIHEGAPEALDALSEFRQAVEALGGLDYDGTTGVLAVGEKVIAGADGDAVGRYVAVQSAITDGVAPSAQYSSGGYYIADSNSDVICFIRPVFNTNGSQGVSFGTQRDVDGTSRQNQVQLFMNSSGAMGVTLTLPAAWRQALGLGTNGSLPLTVAQGGSGATTAAGAADALAVGSLSPVTEITSNTNLDTINTPGSYTCPTNTVAATLTNCPTNQAFRLWVGKVLGVSNSYISQELLTYTGHRFYRVYANGAWVAWVSEIDSLGGTFTGIVTHEGTTTNIKATNVTHGTTPSSSTNGNSALQIRDSAGNLVAQLSARFQANGSEGFQIYAVNGSIYHGLQLTVDSSGKRYVTINEIAPWLDALGLNLVDFKSSVTMTETPLRSHFVKQGSIVHVFWQGASTTHASGATLFTLPSGYRPSQLIDTPFVVAGSAYGVLEISTAGVCTVLHISSTTASGRIIANFTFPVA